MSGSNGDAPVRYVIEQGDKRWVVKLSAADEDASKLAAWVRANEIEGKILVTIEYRISDGWKSVGPMVVRAGELR